MHELMQFLIEHGYVIIFIWVLLDQAGLPLPAVPLLLTAGALAGAGELSFVLIIMTTVMASVPVDLFWYLLGRARGAKVLNLLCSISLEPDYCVRNTQSLFERLGISSLIVAKFVPGLQTLAPPMSGLTKMNIWLFLLLDTLGAIVWVCILGGIGFYFYAELELIANRFAELGLYAGLSLIAIVLSYLGVKFIQRQSFLRSLRTERLTPTEVHALLQSNRNIHVIDLRHEYDFQLQPVTLPSALRVPMEAIEKHFQNIPKSSEIIVYCN